MNVSFSISRDMRRFFFDRAAVMKFVDRRTSRYLASVGGYIRKAARNSIKNPRRLRMKELSKEERRRIRIAREYARRAGKKRPPMPRAKESSKPGQPPLNQTGLLRNFIFFALDPMNRSVVIGPEKLNKPSHAPEVLEYGGVTTVTKHDGSTRIVHIKARPYMQPAFERGTKADLTRRFWREATLKGAA